MSATFMIDSPRSQGFMSATSSPKHGAHANASAHLVLLQKPLLASEASSRHEICLVEARLFVALQMEVVDDETRIKRSMREVELQQKRSRLEVEAFRNRRRARVIALHAQEKEERTAIEMVVMDDWRKLRQEEQRQRLAKGVPRLSQVKRKLLPGSPLSLVQKMAEHQKKTAPPELAPIILANGRQLPPLKPLNSQTLSLLSSLAPNGEGQESDFMSLTSLSAPGFATANSTIVNSFHGDLAVRTLQSLSKELKASRRQAKKQTLMLDSDDPTTQLLRAGRESEIVLWSAQEDNELATQLLQRVGRGFLLRRSIEEIRSMLSGQPRASPSPPEKQTAARHKVSFSQDDDDKHSSAFNTELFVRFDKNGEACSHSFGDKSSHKKPHKMRRLMSIYRLQGMDSLHLSELLAEAERVQDERCSSTVADDSSSKGRLRRSASTLFLVKDSPTSVKKITAKETMRLELIDVDLKMKKHIEELDKQTRENQARQDVKMMRLAQEEAASKEKYRQLMGHLRDKARVLRNQQRESEHERHRISQLKLTELHREFEIKRAELHVEMRQKYMLEDRVTALRKTLTDLGNISHLSATVPSLNLTRAIKEAHFQSEGLVTDGHNSTSSSQKNVEDP